MSDPKFCKDCKYLRRDFPWFFMPTSKVCTAPQGFDMLTGKPVTSFASITRRFNSLCGPSAKWFKPK